MGFDPLPSAYASWTARGIRLHRAGVSMLAGLPGSHKTMVALCATVNMGVPTVMFSTDSSSETVASRLLAIATDTPTDTTETWLRTEPERAGQLLSRFDYITWDFRPNPELDDVWRRVYAHHEMTGQWPELIVVDIASDIGHEVGDEWASLRDLLRQAKVMARETNAHVMLVHHCSDGAMAKPCPRRADIHGKVAMIPELIVTLGKDEAGRLRAACVKNRYARADAQARDHFLMELRADRSFVGDWTGYTAPHPAEQITHDYASWGDAGKGWG